MGEWFDFLVRAIQSGSGPLSAGIGIGALFGGISVVVVGIRFGFLAWPGKVHAVESELRRTQESLCEEQGRAKSAHQILVHTHGQHADAADRHREQVRTLTQQKDELASAVEEWHQRCEESERAFEEQRTKLSQVKAVGRRLLQQVRDTAQRDREQLDGQGQFWERRPDASAPAFRSRAGAKPSAVVVAVVNLKGGVGKTTLTANLGYALSQLGNRVLLVDTDHQATLTTLCLAEGPCQDLRAAGGEKLVDALFRLPPAPDAVAFRAFVPTGATPNCFLYGASSGLLAAEELAKARWLVERGTRDVRFVLRQALHAASLQERFDVVLIDCPPRPTLACVNALAASDFVLAPTLLDRPSLEAIPLLLGWLKRLASIGVCPNAELLGVVANRTQNLALTKKEQSRWQGLASYADEVWGRPARRFRRTIPSRTRFADAADVRAFAAADGDELDTIFRDLAEETLQVLHESRESSVASA